MGMNKVQLENGTVLLDVSQVETNANNVLSGVSFIDNGGNHGVGEYVPFTPSGTLPIDSNGTYNVTDYASVEVNVSGGAQPLPTSYFNFSGNTLTGFSNEGWQAYVNGEITELSLPGSYEDNGNTIPVLTISGFDPNDDYLNIKSIIVPENVTGISEDALRGCYNTTNLSLPNTLTTIGNYCFSDMPLTSIKIPAMLQNIGNNFSGRPSLWELDVDPNNTSYFSTDGAGSRNLILTYDGIAGYTVVTGSPMSIMDPDGQIVAIGSRAFAGVQYFEGDGDTLSLPWTVSSIGEHAFVNCGMVSVDFNLGGNDSYSLRSIGDYAFSGCTNLRDIFIPNDALQSIGEGIFADCVNLKRIIFNGTISEWEALDTNENLFRSYLTQTVIVICADGNKIYNAVTGYLGLEDADGNRDVISISSKVYAGRVNESIFDREEIIGVWIDGSVTRIGDSAFQDCTNMTDFGLASENELESIGEMAFFNCSSLTEVHIPANVTSIGLEAFENCTSLTEIRVSPTTPPSIDNDVFTNTNNCPIIVPSGTLAAYQSAW